MKIIIKLQTILSLLGTLLLANYHSSQCAYSFFAGSGLLLLSFTLLSFGWGLIFRKKLVALAIGVIVIKYAILGIIIFTIVKLSWFVPLWFAMGVASFMLSAICFALAEALKKEGNENVI